MKSAFKISVRDKNGKIHDSLFTRLNEFIEAYLKLKNNLNSIKEYCIWYEDKIIENVIRKEVLSGIETWVTTSA